MITLTNIFSREKTLFYFTMWDESDRLGYKRFLSYEVKNNAFIILPPGKKGSVWYDEEELTEIRGLIERRVKSDPSFVAKLEETLNKYWPLLLPYLKQESAIKGGDDLKRYFSNLVEWWSAMNIAFFVPDMGNVAQEIKDIFLTWRAESEKYTEQMNKTFVATWRRLMPNEAELVYFVTPDEAVKILDDGPNKERLLTEVRERVNGCGMLNKKVYATLSEFHAALSVAGVALQNERIGDLKEIKGAVAFKGRVKGKVRIIHGFADMPSFLAGEILVTEMTNPDYVPIMKKAAAVVTDEGGMTCHAAIASRELQVPCIVGTRVATKVLTTGDLVEVDAEQGVVQIIEK